MKNLVILIGRIASQPETRHAGETAITSFTLVTDRPKLVDGKTVKNEAGYTETLAEFHRVTAFNGLGTSVAKHKKKGDMVEVSATEGGLTINATTFRGYKATGDDTSASANFPGLTFNSNQLGAKVSYAGAMFNAFLRRDGSLPMTGPNPLNMGNQSIVAANDVAATTVTIPNTGDINFGPRNRKMSWLLPRLVEMEGYYVNDGNGIPKPTCDTGGQQSVVLAGVATRGQVYAGDSMAHVRLYVENVGSAWVARIKGWDLTTSADGGGGFPSGFARTFCYYP